MAFPVIPTVAAGRVLVVNQANATSPRTFPNLSSLTKNAGDLLIAIIVAYQSSSGAGAPGGTVFSSWGGSFTEFCDQMTTASSTLAIGAAYKQSTGSETGTFTVVQASTITGHASMILMSIPGAHASTAPEAGTIANGTAAAADPASFDPAGWAAEDTLWIAVGANGETAITGTWTGLTTAPTNFGDYVDTATPDSSIVGQTELAVAFRQLNASSLDVGTFGGNDTSNARNSALLIAVRPRAVLTAAPADTLSLADARTFAFDKSLADAVALSDNISPVNTPPAGTDHEVPIDDTVALADARALSQGKSVVDVVTFTDARTFARGLSVADSLVLADARTTARGSALADTLALADSASTAKTIPLLIEDEIAGGLFSTVLDTFTGSNEDPIATNWSGPARTDFVGQLHRSSNLLTAFSGNRASWYDVATVGADFEVYSTITVLGDVSSEFVFLGVMDAPPDGDGYVQMLRVTGASLHEMGFYRLDGTSFTQLGSIDLLAGGNLSDGDAIGWRRIGDDLFGYVRRSGAWSLEMTRTDATHHDSAARLWVALGSSPEITWRLDDFGGGNITAGLSDSISLQTGKGVSIDDSVALTDQLSRVMAYGRTVSDGVNLADATIDAQGLRLGDVVALVDQLARVTATARSVIDSVSLADARTISQGQAVADSVALTDQLTRTLSLARTLTDSVVLSDQLTTAMTKARTISDSVALSDARALARGKAVADSLALADQLSRTASSVRIFSDSVSLSDQISPTESGAGEQNIDDLLVLSDSFTRIATYTRSIADSVALADQITPVRALSRPLADSIVLSDQLTRTITYVRTVADTIALADQATPQKSSAGTQTIDDLVAIADTLSLALGIHRSLADFVVLSDDVQTLKELDPGAFAGSVTTGTRSSFGRTTRLVAAGSSSSSAASSTVRGGTHTDPDLTEGGSRAAVVAGGDRRADG